MLLAAPLAPRRALRRGPLLRRSEPRPAADQRTGRLPAALRSPPLGLPHPRRRDTGARGRASESSAEPTLQRGADAAPSLHRKRVQREVDASRHGARAARLTKRAAAVNDIGGTLHASLHAHAASDLDGGAGNAADQRAGGAELLVLLGRVGVAHELLALIAHLEDALGLGLAAEQAGKAACGHVEGADNGTRSLAGCAQR